MSTTVNQVLPLGPVAASDADAVGDRTKPANPASTVFAQIGDFQESDSAVDVSWAVDRDERGDSNLLMDLALASLLTDLGQGNEL